MREIEIYDAIGQSFFYDGVTKEDVKAQIKDTPEDEEILLRIDSPGGSVFDATNIISNLRDHKGGFSARVDGLAASAASLIAVAAKRLEMSEGAWMMIHNPHAMIEGDADEHESVAKRLRDMQTHYANAYAKKSGKSLGTIIDDMKAEKWLTDEEAVEYGLADAIVDHHAHELQIAAYFKTDVYHNLPAALAGPKQVVAKTEPQPTGPSKTEAIVRKYESKLSKYGVIR